MQRPRFSAKCGQKLAQAKSRVVDNSDNHTHNTTQLTYKGPFQKRGRTIARARGTGFAVELWLLKMAEATLINMAT